MTYCGTCGKPLSSNFCPDDGWPGPKPGAAQNIHSDRSSGPINATMGDNSPIYYGSADQVRPVVRRIRSKPYARILWLRLLAVVTFAGTVCSITGITLKSVAFPGLLDAWTVAGDEASEGLAAMMPAYALLVASAVCFVLVMSLLGSLAFRKYALAPGGTIWEVRDRRLTRTWIEATCTTCNQRSLRLRKRAVGTRTDKTRDSNGNVVEKERAVVEPRLVCVNNPADHVFKLDPALLVD